MKFFCKFPGIFLLLLEASKHQAISQNFSYEAAEEGLQEYLPGASSWTWANFGFEKRRGTAAGFRRTHFKRPTNLMAVEVKAKGSLKIVNDLANRYQKFYKVSNILQKVLAAVQKELQVTTIALFGLTEPSDLKKVFATNHVPLLVLNDQVNWHISSDFNGNILSIILLKPVYNLEDAIFKVVKQTLYGLYAKKIIIIKETWAGAQKEQLLNWFYLQDFWQTFLLETEGNTSSLTLQPLSDNLWKNSTLEEFLSSDINWLNFHRFPIICSTAVKPPLSFIEYDEQQHIILKGYFGSIISLFAQHYNASLKPFLLNNVTEMGCFQYISSQKTDVCSEGLPYGEEYLITNPEELAQSYLMVPCDKPLPRFCYFLKPFQPNVWSVLILSFCYKIVALSLIHRLQHGSWNTSLQLLYAVVSVLYLPFQLTHIRWPYRGFLEIIMIFVGFVVANWYLSVLSSLLFTHLFSHDINNFQNLQDLNISIMVDEFEFFLLNSTAIDPIIRQQLKLVSSDLLLQHRRNLDPQYAYYSPYDKIDYYLLQQKFLQRPRLKVLLPAVKLLLAGIPMRQNWPFEHSLNRFYRHLFESGICIHLYAEALQEGILSGYLKYFPTEHYYVEALTIEYFQMPAMLLAVGFLLAFLAFLMELFVHKFCYNKRFSKYF